MAHTHDHTQDSNYYLDQLCTIATCGAIGGVCIMMYFDGRLAHILTPFFFVPVFAGGVALVIMAIIRAIALWRSAGEKAAAAHHHHDHVHEHSHDHIHDHDHAHHLHHDHEHGHHHHHYEHDHVHGADCSHDDDCGHDHSWTPARYAVLMLPIVLYFLGLPNSTFSADALGRMVASSETDGGASAVANKEGLVLGFKELTNAAQDTVTRETLQGQTGRLTGRFQKGQNDKQFTLYRVKMSCCAADAIPVGVIIASKENITGVNNGDWVQAEGQIQFHKLRGQDKWMPVLFLETAKQVQPAPAGNDYGLD